MKLGNDTVVLVLREPTGQKDRYGNDVLDDSYLELRWCLVTPAGSTEPGDQSSALTTGLDLLAPGHPPIESVDAVIWPATKVDADSWTGPRYEVDGDVGVWRGFVQARLTKAV